MTPRGGEERKRKEAGGNETFPEIRKQDGGLHDAWLSRSLHVISLRRTSNLVS